MNTGIIYCATGERYLERAILSAKSLKMWSPNLLYSICTNIETDPDLWDHVFKIEKHEGDDDLNMIDKLNTLLLSPYKKTLYLDSDTYILDDITEIFKILERFELAFCHGHNRFKRYLLQTGQLPFKGKTKQVISKDIPYAFAPIQGGLILYNNTGTVKTWLHQLKKIYVEKDFFDDQVSIRELLWKSEVSFYMLPQEYNFNSLRLLKEWKRNGFIQARPKIFHYTLNKGEDIERIINKLFGGKTIEEIFNDHFKKRQIKRIMRRK